MTNPNPIRLVRNLFLLGAGILVVVGFFAAMQVFLASSASSALTLDDGILTEKALSYAKVHGLKNAPVATRASHMSLGQWQTISGGQISEGAAQFGLNPDTPVFVLAIRGDVEWQGLGSSLRDQNSREQFDNITIVIDARSANLLSAGAARSMSAMPIPVPLNALTPAAPIIFAPTKTPPKPPTLAPKPYP